MTETKTLFFPNTQPDDTSLAGLLLLSDTILFYRLPPESPEQSELVAAGLCQGYMPVAFSEEECKRFALLVRDLKGNEGEFYGGYLSSMGMTGQDRDEASVWALISSMSKDQTESQLAEAEKERIWQSMLFLKLAEMLSQEEAEIAAALAAISQGEEELLASIKGGEEDDEEELPLTGLIAQQQTKSAINAEQLARAWGHLFVRDQRGGEVQLLATPYGQTHLLLADIYEAQTDRIPVELGKISLPVVEPAEIADFMANRTSLRQDPAFGRLAEQITAMNAMDRLTSESVSAFGQTLAEIDRALSPLREKSPSCKTLTIYGYETITPQGLFRLLRGAKARNMEPASATTLIAVLD